jgi:hypothetical protein
MLPPAGFETGQEGPDKVPPLGLRETVPETPDRVPLGIKEVPPPGLKETAPEGPDRVPPLGLRDTRSEGPDRLPSFEADCMFPVFFSWNLEINLRKELLCSNFLSSVAFNLSLSSHCTSSSDNLLRITHSSAIFASDKTAFSTAAAT